MRFALRLLFLLGLIVLASPAFALACNFTVSDVNFGDILGASASTTDTTASVSASCTGGLPNSIVRICPNIGPGSAGGSSAARQLSGSTANVDYQLYQDGARSLVWGSVFPGGFGSPPTFDVALNARGSGSGSRTLYARLSLGASARPAQYQSTFSGSPTAFFYAPLVNIGGCTGITVLAPVTYPSFGASATVSPTCQVSVPSLDFGTTTALQAVLDATTSLTLTCTQGTAYSVALGGGNSGQPTARRLKSGQNQLSYGLYRDAARTQVWGEAAGSVASGTGSGGAQNLTVYGRVPAQSISGAGQFTDTVIVTVTY